MPESAIASKQQYAQVERIVQQIQLLRESPVEVLETQQSDAAIVQEVETASRQQGIKQQQLMSITPAKPRRIAETPYLEQQTKIILREVSLKQVIGFVLALTENSGAGFEIPELSFRTPPSFNAAETTPKEEFWNVDLLLTSHLYEPKIPAP
ncbi:MAG: hypothetical protein R3C11_24635 [Planctomycetaceae bacterium]